MDKSGNLVLDIEGLAHTSDKCCSGSPKVMVSQNFIILSYNFSAYGILDTKNPIKWFLCQTMIAFFAYV